MTERIRALFDGDLRKINSYINEKNAAMLLWYISGPWITGRKDLVELKTKAVGAGTQILKEKIGYSGKDYQYVTRLAIGFFDEILKLNSSAFIQSQKTFDVFENINQLLDQCLTHEEINLLAKSYPPDRLLRQTVYETRFLIRNEIDKKTHQSRRNIPSDPTILDAAKKRFQQLQYLEVIYLIRDGSYVPENELDKLKLHPPDYSFSSLPQPPLPLGFEPLVPALKPLNPYLRPLEELLEETKKTPCPLPIIYYLDLARGYWEQKDIGKFWGEAAFGLVAQKTSLETFIRERADFGPLWSSASLESSLDCLLAVLSSPSQTYQDALRICAGVLKEITVQVLDHYLVGKDRFPLLYKKAVAVAALIEGRTDITPIQRQGAHNYLDSVILRLSTKLTSSEKAQIINEVKSAFRAFITTVPIPSPHPVTPAKPKPALLAKDRQDQTKALDFQTGQVIESTDHKKWGVQEVRQGAQAFVLVVKNPDIDRTEVLRIYQDTGNGQKAIESAKLLIKMRTGLPQSLRSHLPEIYGTLEDTKGNRFLRMEYVNGETTAELMEKQIDHRLTQNQVIQILKLAVPVLEFLHSKHPNGPFVLRDIKPTNIMLNLDQKGSIVDLYFPDWDVTIKAGKYTDNNLAYGTEVYAAREQIFVEQKGYFEIWPITDIYALGITINQWLTGIEPQGKNYDGDFDQRFPELVEMVKLKELDQEWLELVEGCTRTNTPFQNPSLPCRWSIRDIETWLTNWDLKKYFPAS